MTTRKSRAIRIMGSICLIATGTILFGNDLLRAIESPEPSESVGTVSSGSLVNGKRFPTSGPNFRTHSRITSVLGRNSVHSTVRDICLDAYAALEATTISQSFVYGEAGWPSGGPFSPHKTHQNGLAVDFMVPVLDVDSNSPRRLPTHPFNLAGYALDFDQSGGRGSMRLDFDAIAAHVLALNDAAKLQGATIKLVIFAPDLQDEFFAAGQGHELKRAVKFNSNQAWVRHDEHYHVVFGL